MRLEKEFLTRSAAVDVVRGLGDMSGFEQASTISFEPGTVPHDYGPIRHVWALALCGRYEEAEAVATDGLGYPQALGAEMLVQRLALMAAISSSLAGNFGRASAWSELVTPWAVKADLHVAVLSWLQRGIDSVARDHSDVAERTLGAGARFAADNGFLLEWLDMTAFRAYLAMVAGERQRALALARMVIEGEPSAYLAPMAGAADRNVGYVWPLVCGQRDRDALWPARPARCGRRHGRAWQRVGLQQLPATCGHGSVNAIEMEIPRCQRPYKRRHGPLSRYGGDTLTSCVTRSPTPSLTHCSMRLTPPAVAVSGLPRLLGPGLRF